MEFAHHSPGGGRAPSGYESRTPMTSMRAFLRVEVLPEQAGTIPKRPAPAPFAQTVRLSGCAGRVPSGTRIAEQRLLRIPTAPGSAFLPAETLGSLFPEFD